MYTFNYENVGDMQGTYFKQTCANWYSAGWENFPFNDEHLESAGKQSAESGEADDGETESEEKADKEKGDDDFEDEVENESADPENEPFIFS